MVAITISVRNDNLKNKEEQIIERYGKSSISLNQKKRSPPGNGIFDLRTLNSYCSGDKASSMAFPDEKCNRQKPATYPAQAYKVKMNID